MTRNQLLLIGGLWQCVTACALAQPVLQAPQRQGGPRPLLLNQGSVGAVSAIEFSPDSRFIYVAGLDKAIHMWSLFEVQPNDFRPTFMRSMRWEISRGNQGRFDAIALTPNGEMIAAAGTSTRNGGDIGLWDTGIGFKATPPVFPLERSNDLPIEKTGHAAAVTGISFSPDGGRLVSVDDTGAIWQWDRATGKGTLVQLPSPKVFPLRMPILFVDNKYFAAPVLQGKSCLVVFDLMTNLPVTTLDDREIPILAMAKQRGTGIWASANEIGEIHIWNGVANPQQAIRLDPNLIDKDQAGGVVSMSFLGPDLLVAARHRTSKRPTAHLEIWNWRNGRLVQALDVGRFDDCRAVAVSPNGRWLAHSFPDGDEIRLIPLTAGPFQQLPPVDAHLRMSGRGQPIWEAQFSSDPDTLRMRFSNRRRADPNTPPPAESIRGFDLKQLRLLDGDEVNAMNMGIGVRHQDSDAGPWSLQVRRVSRDAKGVEQVIPSGLSRLVDLFADQKHQGSIMLDADFQGPLRSYCWIAQPGANQPFAVALGTEDHHGIYVYSLPVQGRPSRLLRYFRDHTGAVTSLSVSPDRRMLMSSSLDQTVKFWSLEQLTPDAQGFSNRSAWGAEFKIEQGALIARNVIPQGIAARRGINEGNQIQFIGTADFNQPRQVARIPADMLRLLETREIFKEMHIIWQNGPKEGRPIVPAWEPIATFFIDNHDEWILFTPDGVFHASAAEGPILLGWQYNRGRTFDPEIIEAGELIKDLRKPDVLKQLLGNFVPPPANLTVDVTSAGRPEIRIISPKLTDPPPATDAPIKFVAHIEHPPASNPATVQKVVYVNSERVNADTGPLTPSPNRPTWKQEIVTADLRPTQSLNSLRVNLETGDNLQRASETLVSSQPRPSRKFKLHLVSITCQNYQKKGRFDPLTQAKADGDAIRDELIQKSGDYFSFGNVWRVDDTVGPVSRLSIQNKLKEVYQKLQDAAPDDLLVVYLSGHGHVVDGKYRYVPSSPVVTNERELLADGLCMSDFERICSLPCRILYLIDSCRSGDIADSSTSLFDEARQRCVMVFAAASQGQKALEAPPPLKLSMFTLYLVDGMRGEADGCGEVRKVNETLSVSRSGEAGPKDQVIKFSELTAYIERGVYKSTGRKQRPCLFNRQRSQFFEFELCKVTKLANAK